MQYLGVILFLPWFIVIGGLFVLFPRTPGGAARRLFELFVLGVALALSIWAMLWGYVHASPNAGAIWKQVLATLLAYTAFLAVVLVAIPVRGRVMRRK